MALTIDRESYNILKRAGSRSRRHRTNHQKARRYVQHKLRYEGKRERERERCKEREREREESKNIKKDQQGHIDLDGNNCSMSN